MNNPPAFPSGNDVTLGDWKSHGHSGMTLRDYFAAKASEEDIEEHSVGSKSREAVARGTGFPYIKREEVHYTREQAKFRYADAMLKAREA
jgi:hypothetical protein